MHGCLLEVRLGAWLWRLRQQATSKDCAVYGKPFMRFDVGHSVLRFLLLFAQAYYPC